MIGNSAHTATTTASDKTWTVTYNGAVVAQSSSVKLVHESYGGNNLAAVPYFPADDVQVDLDGPTELHTSCPVKGRASYYSVNLDQTLDNSIWFYPEPLSPLEPIAGHVAFYGDRYDISSA